MLHAIAEALRLEAEQAYLFDLARAARGRAREPRRRPQPQLRPSILRILESMTTSAAFIRNGRLDILAANPLGRALYAPELDGPARPPNLARFNFSTTARPPSTPTGTTRPTPPSPCCAPRPDVTPTTAG